MLVEHVDSRFAGRYSWFTFRPGKSSQKHQTYSRAYIDFRTPQDVIDFAEFFDGHVFVNEKGTQFKAIVEYAPSQRIPKNWPKKDGREGTILKDPEYLEFLEFLTKPVENLPSAEVQLERKEAERAGSAKDAPIVTPLMDYVRQKRAAKSGARRSVSNGKSTKRVSGTTSGSPSSIASTRGSEKRRIPTKMYVVRYSSKGGSAKSKTFVLAPKHDDQQISDKSGATSLGSGTDALEGETGGSRTADSGKKKILLLKGKEKEIPNVSSGSLVQQNVASTPKKSVPRQNQQREASGRIIRSILLKDARQNQSSIASQSEHQIHDKDKKPPWPLNVQLFQKDASGANGDKVVRNDLHVHIEKQEKRSRIRDRPDRGVWTPLRHADSSLASDESVSSANFQSYLVRDFVEGSKGEMKSDLPSSRGGEFRQIGSGHNPHVDNGIYKHGNRRGLRDADGASAGEGKSLRKGVTSGYGSNEKQVWVQKSSSGS